jgi:hypothetical protein
MSEEISTTDLHERAEEAWKSGDLAAAAVFHVGAAAAVFHVGEAICHRLDGMNNQLGSLDTIWMEVSGLRGEMRDLGDLENP